MVAYRELQERLAGAQADLLNQRLTAIEKNQDAQNGHLRHIDEVISRAGIWCISMLTIALGSLALTLVKLFLGMKAG
jgi:hypothetical protein